MRLDRLLLAVIILLYAIKLDDGQYFDGSGCHESCSICKGDTENDCVATCPVYEEEGEPIPVLQGGGLYISDEDLNDIFPMQSAVIEVFPQTTNDFSDIKLSVTVPDGITAMYDSNEGVLFIDGEASLSTYQSILNNVSFSIENSEPDVEDRIICFTVFDGMQPSEPSCITLKISLLNDNEPSFNFTPTALPYTEGGDAVELLEELEIMDGDDPDVFPMQNATISVANWCGSTDVILVNTSGTNIVQTTEGPCITLSGNDTPDNYRKVFLSARYDNTADEPDVSLNRTIVFALFDGEGDVEFNISIDLVPVDDHQTEIIIDPKEIGVTEREASEWVLLSGKTQLNLTDADTNDDVLVSELVIEIEEPSPIEQLTLSPTVHYDIIVAGNTTSHIRLNGSSLIQNYQQALGTLQYGFSSMDAEIPCPRVRKLIFTVEGSLLSKSSDYLIIEITPVNDYPPVLVAAESVNFTENEYLNPLKGIAITDEDELCMMDTLNSAEVILFSASNTETIQFGNFTWLTMEPDVCTDSDSQLEPTPEQLHSNMAPLSYSYCSDSEDVQLRVMGTTTIEQYLILLESLVYFNQAEEPPQINRTLQVSVNDSIFNSDTSITIETVQVNDQSPMVYTNGSVFSHYENGTPTVMVGPSATIIDNDGQSEHKAVSHFCVTIENPQLEDELSYQNDFGLTNGSYSSPGSGSSSDSDNTYDANMNSTQHLCVEVSLCENDFTYTSCFYSFLSAVTFLAATDEPNLDNRTVSFTAYDSTNGLQYTSYVTVRVIPINDKPHFLYLDGVLELTQYHTNFSEGGVGVSLSRQLRIEDEDTGRRELTSATITILNYEIGDKILINKDIANDSDLVIEGNSSYVYIEIVGVATQDVYAKLLASAIYVNLADEPTPPNESEDRVIIFTVTDEERTAVANSTVTLYAVNDPPELPIVTVVYNETTQEPVYLFNSSVSIDDSDHDNLQWLTIELMPPVDFLDNLTLPEVYDTNIRVVQYGGKLAPKTACYPAENSNTTQKIALYGPAATESFDRILRNITFSNSCPGLKPEQRSINVTLSDGEDVFTSWVYIDIATVVDPPVCYFGQWPGVTTISRSYSENMSPIDIGSGFTLVDLDGPMEYTDVVTVTISLIRDEGEEVLDFTLSGNITLTNQTFETSDGYFTSVYELRNGTTFTEYLEVLRSMTYVNRAIEPSTYLPRLVTISISQEEFVDCSIEVTVKNTPDPPVVTIQAETVSYTEDSNPVSVVTDSADITITDEDNIFLFEARFEVTNTPSLYDPISDTLSVSNDNQFTITGSGVGGGIITATAKTFDVRHSTFVELIRSLKFETDDQATNITREISVVVEEYPLGETGPSSPVIIPVQIIQRNDRPVLISSPLVTQETLRDFLPPETANVGFFPSHLVDASVVNDPDSVFPYNLDIIGLSVFAIDDGGIGYWQYWWGGAWVNVVNVSRCDPLFVKDDQRIRFLPSPNVSADNGGLVLFNYSVWDGTTENVCIQGEVRTDQEVSISSGEAAFNYIVVYDPPVFQINEKEFTYIEGGSPIMIFENLTVDGVIANVEVNIYCQLCTEPLSGAERIKSELETFQIETDDSVDPITFKISSTSNKSTEAFQVFLRSLMYYSSSEEPEPFDRIITLTATDGIGSSNTVSVTVSVQQINDNPPYFNLPKNGLQLVEGETENGFYIFTDPATIRDDDYGLNLKNLSVYFEGYPCELEMLTLNLSSSYFLSDAFSNDSRFVFIEGPASIDKFNKAVNHLEYVNVEEEPYPCSSSLVFEVSDGIFSTSTKVGISFLPVNDNLPEVSLAQNKYEFKEEMNKKKKNDVHDFYPLQSISVTDADIPDTPVVSAQVTLINPLDGDEEYIQLQGGVYDPIDLNAVSVFQNNTHLIINSTGEGISTIVLQENLRKVIYYNSDSDPNTIQRVISVTVADEIELEGVKGIVTTAPVYVYINITPYNNPPEVVLHEQLIDYVGKLSDVVSVAPNADVSDPENDNLEGLIVTLTGNFSISSNEHLAVNESRIPEGIELTNNVTSADLSRFGDENLIHLISFKLSGEASGKEYTNIVRSLTYENNDVSPDQFGTRTLYVLPIGSEEENGVKDLVQISFNEVNVPPVVDLNGLDSPGHDNIVTFTEDSGTPVLLSENANITDMSSQTNLSFVTILLDPHLNGISESLGISVLNNIEIVWNSPNSSLTLRGKPTASLYSFTEALHTLVYINLADEPIVTTRYVRVLANDGGLNSNIAVTTINILSVNDKPNLRLAGAANLLYVENSNPLIIFVEPVLMDSDSNLFARLRVIERTGFPGDVISSDQFEFDHTGQYYTFNSNSTSEDLLDLIRSVTFSSSSDEPAIGKRQYCIAVSDGVLWSDPVCVNITFVPVNDNLPYFTKEVYKANVTEEKPNVTFLQLAVEDEDSANSEPVYEWDITAGDDCHSHPLAACRFQIDSYGLLSVSGAPPDREDNSSYTLTVAISEDGFLNFTTTMVEVDVLDINDNAPVFSGPLSASVEENSPVETIVLTLSATDADVGSNANVRFTLKTLNTPFRIDDEANRIIVANTSELDRERKDSYELQIEAYNPNDITGGPNSTATVNVEVTDRNDNSPFVPDLNINIKEDFTPNTDSIDPVDAGSGSPLINERYIITVTANDSDDVMSPNSVVKYSIIEGGGDVFEIDQITGDIIATVLLDREIQVTYSLIVGLEDSGDPPLTSNVTLLITLTDVNDNSPTFTMFHYEAFVLEGQSNMLNLTVTANDADEGENKEVKYRLQEDNGLFSIDEDTGKIELTVSLDRENQSSYTFVVEAYDLGSPSLTGSAVVTINITDINDHPPMILLTSLNDTIDEHSPVGTVVARFSVTDNDEHSNAESDLTLIGGGGKFAVNQVGVVTVADDIDYETLSGGSFFTLTLLARNLASPQFSESYDFTVEINNINDNAPIIVFANGEVTFVEGSDFAVNLDVGITIKDLDGRNFTRIYDAKVELLDADTREPSFPFAPTTDENPSYCPLEDKEEKMYACGLSKVGTVIIPTDINEFGSIQSDDNTLVFDGSQEQYGVEKVSLSDVKAGNDISIMTWIWYTPTPGPSTIFASVSRVSGNVTYGALCHNGTDMEFLYQATGAQNSHTFINACEMLTDQWHHLAIVVDSLNGTQVSLFIDGMFYSSALLPQPEDEANDRLFLGARPISGDSAPVKDFFTGKLHRMTMSSSVVREPNINCIIGCGVYLYSSQLSPVVPYSYNYNERKLFAEGIREVGVYEGFLDTLIFVIAFSEPRQLSYDFDYTVTDGGFNCIPVTLNITIEPSNDGDPELNLNGPLGQDFSAVYVEEQGAVEIVNSTSLTLVDVDLLPYPYEIVATITNPLQPSNEEVLSVSDLPAGMTKSYSDHVLRVQGMFTIDVFETVLRTLTYNNVADEPLGTTRTVTVFVDDPLEGPRKSNTAYSSLSIIYVNDPPAFTFERVATDYYEGDGTVAILNNTAIEDSDNEYLVSGTISFKPLDGNSESISVNTTFTNISYTVSITDGVIILSLEGKETLNVYEDVFDSLTYENSNENNITAGDRVFSIVLFDGLSYSVVSTTALYVHGVNDQPIIDINGPFPSNSINADFIEDVDTEISISSSHLTIIDVDSNSLVSASINFESRPDAQEEYVSISSDLPFSLSDTGNTTISIEPLSGTASLKVFEEVLKTLRYVNTAEEPTPGIRTLELTVDDGQDASSPATIIVMIKAINDPPYLDLDSNNNGTGFSTTFTENGPAVSISSDYVRISDNDAGAFISHVLVVLNNPGDGSNEMILSNSPTVLIPPPATVGGSSTYNITNTNGTSDSATAIIMSLTYNNTAFEPVPGMREIDVSVHDGSSYSNTARVDITIDLVNEFTPIFQPIGTRTVFENRPPLTEVANVVAVDGDSGIPGEIKYSLTKGYPAVGVERFQIDAQSGIISTVIELDRENISFYILTIKAVDGGVPSRSAETNVSILVQNENDNIPMFAEEVFYAEVSELAELSTVVAIAVAIDQDNPDVPPFFSIQGVSDFFDVMVGGDIVVVASLDADVPNPVYNVTVLAEDTSFGPGFDTAIFVITVLDENDNSPVFDKESYEGSIPENLNGASIVTVSASDQDSTINGQISYYFMENSTYDDFAIDESTGLITTNRPLDREEQEVYQITVLAVDGGSPLNTGSVVVTITLLDVNDNSPTFDQSSYNISIPEQGFGTLRVSANDPDKGMNSTIDFSINAGNIVFDLLTVGSATDILIYADQIDYEINETVTGEVVATDNGPEALFSTVPLTIFIEDINDNAPIFIGQPYAGEVPENAVNYFVTSVAAADVDSGSNGAVRFKLGNYKNDFIIDEISGEIRTSQGLDFEDQCFIELSVIAFDLGTPRLSSTAIVEVTVTALNDEPPSFNQSMYTGSVIESSVFSGEEFVTQVFAIDDDYSVCELISIGSGEDSLTELTDVTYTLLNHNADFRIDPVSGMITAISKFDREITPEYTLIVSASDLSSLSNNVSVIVTIEDINDNEPMFLEQSYELAISENLPVNTSILQVIATDLDTLDNGKLQYSIPGGNEQFEVEETSGVIVLSKNIDFEDEDLIHTFFVVVRDTSGKLDITQVIITISDANDHPPSIDTPSETLVFMEGQVSLVPFTEISISDADSFQHLFSAVVTLSTPEAIENSDFGCYCSNTSDASTCDKGCLEFLQIPQSSFPGNISLSNNSFIIVLTGNFSISVYEAAIKSVTYINTLSNPSPNTRNISLTVNDGKFTSNTFTNVVQMILLNQFAPVLDLNGLAEEGIGYAVNFTEEGSAVVVVSDSVSITDGDSLLASPMVTMLEIWIDNPLDEGSEVLRFTPGFSVPAELSVSTSQHKLVITGSASNESYITILKQVEYLNSALEPNPTQRQINFKATEYHLSSETATTLVTIVTSNDHSPFILLDPPLSNYAADYKETAGLFQIASQNVEIGDDDSTEEPLLMMQVYLLSPGQFDQLSLVGVNISDNINVQQLSQTSLLFEGRGSYQEYEDILRSVYYSFTDEEFSMSEAQKFVFVLIADKDYSTFSITCLTLKPENDQQPKLTNAIYIESISENATVGTSIIQLTASDGDTFSESKPQFSVSSGNAEGLFSINNTTGIISVAQKLDFEQNKVHVLTVQVEDLLYDTGSEGPDTSSLEIIIGDVNDNVPQFNQSFYNASIGEGVPLGTLVLQVGATDFDSSVHSQLIFSIVGTSDFSINQNGEIKTSVVLDRESVAFYYFNVTVRNPGSLKQDFTQVIIEVLDLDDNPPVLILSPEAAILREPNKTTALSQALSITDPDPLPSLDKANISIISGPGSLFIVETTAGVVVEGNNTQTLIFIGIQSLSDYESLLRSAVYVDAAEEPIIVDRLVVYEVFSGESSASSTFTVTVEAINDQIPMILLSNGSNTLNVNFVEDGDSVLLSGDDLSITDPDTGENMISYAVVELLIPLDGNDEKLEVTVSNGLVLDPESSISRLVITGLGTHSDYEAVLRTVTYFNTAEAPNDQSRGVKFIVNDGLFNSTPAVTYISITLINDPPVLTLGPNSLDTTAVYIEGQQLPLILAAQLDIQDVDSEVLTSATVFLTGATEEESLNVSSLPPQLTMTQPSNGQIILSAASGESIQVFKEALRSVTYFTNRETPYPAAREVVFIVTDESAQSSPAIARVTFNSSDDTPIIDLNGPLVPGVNFTTTYEEDTENPVKIVSLNVSISDIDSDVVTNLTVTILTAHSGDIFTLPDIDGLSKSESNGVFTYLGAQSPDIYEDLLRSFSFENTLEEHSNEDRHILFQVFTPVSGNGHFAGSNVAESIVKVSNTNDQAPVFDQDVYNGFVYENSNPGSEVGVVVMATDQDIPSNANVQYSIDGGSSLFNIDSVSGAITTLKLLDAEQLPSAVTFVVVAEDSVAGVVHTATATVNISIGDLNDNPPEFRFSQHFASVDEHESIGSLVYTLNASDRDRSSEHSTVRYLISVDSDSGSGLNALEPIDLPFAVGELSGEITVAGDIDSELQMNYTIPVVASDGINQAETIVTVNVVDINDNPPIFINQPYHAEVSEGAELGKSILTVSAIDYDMGANAKIVYNIEGTILFNISETTGEVYVAAPLDYETQSSDVFTVVASDGSFNNFTQVNISILNENDNSPMFTESAYFFSYPENVQFKITAVDATDADGDVLTFSILNSCNDGFVVDSTNGEISSTEVLDREEYLTCDIVAAVTDGLYTTSVTIVISVSDENDNSPVFSSQMYQVTIPEALPIGSKILTVSASDADEGMNSALTYSLVEGTSMFNISSSAGAIYLASSVDFESIIMYNLTVEARDGGETPRVGTAKVEITVNDTNDEAPVLFLSETSISYTEESGSVLLAGDIQVIDPDTKPLISSRIVLILNECPEEHKDEEVPCSVGHYCSVACGEALFVDSATLGSIQVSHHTEGHNLYLNFTGEGSTAEYQSILSTLRYVNAVDEPIPGDRRVEIIISDDSSESNVLTITVNVTLVDDHCALLTSSSASLSFLDGSAELNVGKAAGLIITDADRPPHQTVSNIRVVVEGLVDENEIVSFNSSFPSLAVDQIETDSITVFTITGTTNIEVYTSLLQTLLYSNLLSEPTSGTRKIELTLFSESSNCSTLELLVNVELINDNPPVITFEESHALTYVEESGALLIGDGVGLQLTDEDSTFPLKQAVVQLLGTQDEIEELNLNINPVPEDVIIENNKTSITIQGEVSIETYENLIRSVYYLNAAPEPIPGIRTVTIAVSDGSFETVANLTINVLLVNDNPIMLTANTSELMFLEGNTSLSIGELSGIYISDMDDQAVVHTLSIELSNTLESSKETISTEGFGLVMSESELIFFNQTASLPHYQAILNSLTYTYMTEGDEPQAGIRTITIVAANGEFTATLILKISVEILNNYPSVLTFEGLSTVVYNETLNAGLVLGVGALMLPVVSDADNNELFLLSSAAVSLVDAADGENEVLNTDDSVPSNIEVKVFNHSIIFSGNATINEYQQALRAITYQNTAPEPTATIRSLSFQVSDNKFTSNILSGYIVIRLINDNDLVLSCDTHDQFPVFTEGSETPISLSPNLSLSDPDANQPITGATVTITNAQNGDSLSVVSSNGLTVVNSGTQIFVTGESSVSEYQDLLQNITFLNTADEPEAVQRVVSITVLQSSTSVSCLTSVSIVLINDNKPVVDLSGPTEASINRTTLITYNYLSASNVAVASENATITDTDTNSIISSFDIDIILRRNGDRLIMNPDICAATTETLCYINIPVDDGPFFCSCGGHSSNPTDLSAKITPTSVTVTQSGNLSTAQMELALRELVFFEHGPPPVPDSSYFAEMIVTVGDGEFTSDTATTTVMVEYQNSAPFVFIEDQNLYGEAVMSEGQTTLAIAKDLSVSDDVGLLSQVSVQLTNPVHADNKSIFLSISANSNIQLDGSSNSTYLLLTGEAGTSLYSSVLQTLTFGYSKMESLLEQQPNINNRIIAISATDSIGATGPTSVVTVIFNRKCSVWSAGSPIRVPAALSIQQLGICTSVSGFHIRISGEVSSLLPLQDLETIDSLSLVDVPNLQTLEGLENLSSFSELVFDDVDGLTTMEHFGSNLPSDHRVEIQSIAVRNCDSLTNIDGLRIVENITNLVQIQNCGSLGDLSGLRNLLFVGTMFLIQLPATEIVNFYSLFEASDLWIYNNPSLKGITGFQNLRSLEMLNVISNANLINIDGLSGLLQADSVRIIGNPKLCYIGTDRPSAEYWQNLEAQTFGDFVTANCPNRTCSDSPCLNNAQCIDSSESYTCNCTDFFEGSSCQFYNECNSSSPCQNGGTCSTSINALRVQQYLCSCPDGTSGFDCELLD